MAAIADEKLQLVMIHDIAGELIVTLDGADVGFENQLKTYFCQ